MLTAMLWWCQVVRRRFGCTLETMYDLALCGHNVYGVDHRGQGLSERLLENPHIGHVACFDDYVQDLLKSIKQLLPDDHLPVFALAHSMGGAIALQAAFQMPTCFTAVALVAPMLGIRLPLPRWMILKWIARDKASSPFRALCAHWTRLSSVTIQKTIY